MASSSAQAIANASGEKLAEDEAPDWSYRMIIEDRYRRLVLMRRGIRITALAQLVYICLRTLWHSIPFFTGEDPLAISAEYIFYAGVALFLMRAWAFGFGKANRERLGAIMAYSVCSMLLLCQCILIFYMYYVDEKMMGRGANWQYPHMLAKHYAARWGFSAATVITVGQYFERTLDVLGLIAGATNVYLTKEYVLEKKEQKREATVKKEAAASKKD